jgi:superoxide reductase
MKRREFVKNTVILSTAAATSAAFFSREAAAGAPPQRLGDPKNPAALEKKHVPLVQAPGMVKRDEWFDVKVNVGFMTPHPSAPGHWIEEVDLLVNGKKVSEIENETGGTTSPDACFRIRLTEPAELEAVSTCNLHGTWISQPVKVAVTK